MWAICGIVLQNKLSFELRQAQRAFLEGDNARGTNWLQSYQNQLEKARGTVSFECAQVLARLEVPLPMLANAVVSDALGALRFIHRARVMLSRAGTPATGGALIGPPGPQFRALSAPPSIIRSVPTRMSPLRRTGGGRPRRRRSPARKSPLHRRGHPIPYRPRGLAARRGPVAPGSTRGHSVKFEHCVTAVKRRGSAVNPYAVCVASVGW